MLQVEWASKTAPAGVTLLPCTVVIAAKNEGLSIGDIVKVCTLYAQEVLVVDGHSTDDTAQKSKDSGARIVTDNKLGKGDALRVGVAAAKQEVVVFLDADGSHDPHDIPAMVKPILDGKSDMVIGSRMTGGSDELSGNFDLFVRLVSGQIITLGINLRYGSQLSDSQNGFRAIRKSVFTALGTRENKHTIEQEMLMRALKLGYRVGETPSHEYKRIYGKSHIRLTRMWFAYIWSWLKGLI